MGPGLGAKVRGHLGREVAEHERVIGHVGDDLLVLVHQGQVHEGGACSAVCPHLLLDPAAGRANGRRALRACGATLERGSPLDSHVAVQPELHEVGLQVGVRHVQQHLCEARARNLSARRRGALPEAPSVPWMRLCSGGQNPTANSPVAPRRCSQANVYAPVPLREVVWDSHPHHAGAPCQRRVYRCWFAESRRKSVSCYPPPTVPQRERVIEL